MKNLVCLALLSLIGTCIASPLAFYSGWENKGELKRTVDITSHIEEVSYAIEAENGGSQKADHYLIALRPERAQRLAHITATVDKQSLDVGRTDVAAPNAPAGTVFYKIALNKPVDSGKTVRIDCKLTFTRTLVPYPDHIAQNEPQLVRYTDNAYTFSPYTSESQTARLKLGSSTVESYTDRSATNKGDEIEYGPFSDVPPFAYDELVVHYENNSPFVTMVTLRKEIEISHWGNVAVEEHYLLQHTGAALKGSFSRYDYQRSPLMKGNPSFRQITAHLPASADGIYYRDRIGNISTSHVRKGRDETTFEVEPRFPMFGGWKTDFYIGYNLPAHQFLSVDSNSGKYVLSIPFGTPFPQAAVDSMELKVILPEFASDIQWTTPFHIDSEGRETRVTYLDTVGRPVLVLKKDGVTRQHSASLQVSYRFPTLMLLQEPLLLATAFFLFFLASAAYMRFELSISS